jgi:FlaA1/EpsC-like NDP-sugar epimerase
MGAPVNIADVARLLICRAQRNDIDIVYTGLRAGEKMCEALFGDGEAGDYRPAHPLVSHVRVPPLALLDGEAGLGRFTDHSSALQWMAFEATVTAATPVLLTGSRTVNRMLAGIATDAKGSAL